MLMLLELVHPSGWYDTSVEEMKAFIGMLCISKLSTLEMYWSTNNLELAPLLIRGVMPRSRQLLDINSINSSQGY